MGILYAVVVAKPTWPVKLAQIQQIQRCSIRCQPVGRDAFGIDLQRAVHEDMVAHFAAYPRHWGLKRPDRNIDHRRVPNLERFWQRAGADLPLPGIPADWRPGDLFSSLVGGCLPHTGIVSDKVSPRGVPLVIHNIGRGTQEEEISAVGRMIGRYRWQV